MNQVMQFFQKKDRSYPLILLSTLSILPFLIISFFNHPSGDDYDFTVASQNLGFLGAQKDLYFKWTGRYFSTALLSVNPLVFYNFFLYKIIPIVLILLLVFLIYFLARNLFSDRKLSLSVSSIFILLYFYNMPSISEGLYWLAGSVTYQLANIFTLLFAICLLKYQCSNKIFYFLCCLLLSFFIVGSNETSMLLLVVVLFELLVVIAVKNKKLDWRLLVLLIISLVFSIVVIKAPGNSVRETYFPNKHQVLLSIKLTFQALVSYFVVWLPAMLLLTILFVDILKDRIGEISHSIFKISPLFSFIVLMITSVVGIFPGVWSLGNTPPARTFNVIYFFLIVSYIHFVLTVVRYLYDKGVVLSMSPVVPVLVYGIIFVSLYNQNNIRKGYADILTGRAYSYDKQVEYRYALIKSTDSDTCMLPVIINAPATIFGHDITADPSNWKNRSFSTYFGKKSIILSNK